MRIQLAPGTSAPTPEILEYSPSSWASAAPTFSLASYPGYTRYEVIPVSNAITVVLLS